MRFARFLVVGAFNTAVGYGLYALAVSLIDSVELALFLATVAGVIMNFFTTGTMVFGSSSMQLLPRFILCYVVVYIVNVASLQSLIAFGLNKYLAQAVLLPFIALFTYLLLGRFVFVEGRDLDNE